MLSDTFTITRRIEFDAGHRVPSHAGKCRSPHGHRYCVEIDVEGQLATDGSEEGMVLDFGFLKEVLVGSVHDILDHSFIVYKDDVVLLNALQPPRLGYAQGDYERMDWKVVVFPHVPTAENLARWIAGEIEDEIADDSEGRARLAAVRVWETPNSVAMVELSPELEA